MYVQQLFAEIILDPPKPKPKVNTSTYEIPRCTCCQKYGFTTNFCQNNPRPNPT